MNKSFPIQPLCKEPVPLTTQFKAILFLVAVFASGCVVHSHGRGHGPHPGPVVVQPRVAIAKPVPVTVIFTDQHRHAVRKYYHKHPHHHGKKHKWKNKHRGRGRGRGHLPPGLAKRDVLPPGIQMQAIHGDLARQLPHAPHGTRYTYHEDQVLLIDLNTRVVLDFINISVSAGF
jgi:hypothetical protein